MAASTPAAPETVSILAAIERDDLTQLGSLLAVGGAALDACVPWHDGHCLAPMHLASAENHSFILGLLSLTPLPSVR